MSSSIEIIPEHYSVSEIMPDHSAYSIEVSVATMGPPGPGGGGVTYIQDSQPIYSNEKEIWYNPLTLQQKVFTNGEWKPVAPDGGYF